MMTESPSFLSDVTIKTRGHLQSKNAFALTVSVPCPSGLNDDMLGHELGTLSREVQVNLIRHLVLPMCHEAEATCPCTVPRYPLCIVVGMVF